MPDVAAGPAEIQVWMGQWQATWPVTVPDEESVTLSALIDAATVWPPAVVGQAQAAAARAEAAADSVSGLSAIITALNSDLAGFAAIVDTGAAGHVLTADGAGGVSWEPAPAGGGGGVGSRLVRCSSAATATTKVLDGPFPAAGETVAIYFTAGSAAGVPLLEFTNNAQISRFVPTIPAGGYLMVRGVHVEGAGVHVEVVGWTPVRDNFVPQSTPDDAAKILTVDQEGVPSWAPLPDVEVTVDGLAFGPVVEGRPPSWASGDDAFAVAGGADGKRALALGGVASGDLAESHGGSASGFSSRSWGGTASGPWSQTVGEYAAASEFMGFGVGAGRSGHAGSIAFGTFPVGEPDSLYDPNDLDPDPEHMFPRPIIGGPPQTTERNQMMWGTEHHSNAFPGPVVFGDGVSDDTVRWVRTKDGGKTVLSVQFATGDPVEVAREP